MQGLEQSLADMAEQNTQLQAALRRFLAWQGPPVRMVASAATQVHVCNACHALGNLPLPVSCQPASYQ